MLPFEDRYTRQRQLREVGLEGQTRLQNSRFAPEASDLLTPAARIVAVDYLQRAGVPVAGLSIDANPSKCNPDTTTPGHRKSALAHFRFSGPTQVAAGALAALQHIRSVLGLDTPPSGQ